MAIRLRPFEASEYLQKKHGIKRGVGTLAKYRCIGGGGPKYQRAGREILYEPRHLDEYAAQILSAHVSSTSEYRSSSSAA